MMGFRERVGMVWIGMALFVPSETFSQANAAALPTTSAAPASTAVPLDTTNRLDGRLFFSAQERQRLDNVRKRGLVLGNDGQPVQAPPSILNGFVKRSDGSAALWIDGNVRWNAQGKNTASLVPSDVGGPAEYVRATVGEPKALASRPTGRTRKAVKPRAKTVTKPRLLP